jgi:Ras-related GTP-binding protein A/B
LCNDFKLTVCSQDGFVENYLTQSRNHVFGSVAVLIFVFDIESREFPADVISYSNIIRALHECSPGAKVFCLIHKMDLVQARLRQAMFDERADYIREASEGFKDTVEFFATSIWDQSLYKAWTKIIYYLIPNAGTIEALLEQLAEVIDARELILYERTTCLTVAHVTRKTEEPNPFTDRFERISSILKTHKQSMAYVQHTLLYPMKSVTNFLLTPLTGGIPISPPAAQTSPKCRSRLVASCFSSRDLLRTRTWL